MKKIALLGCLLTLLALCLDVGVMAQLARIPFSRSEPDSNSQKIDVKVIKVFSLSDDHANFRAYIVDWKGQEVVATDVSARTKYKEGDIITVFLRRRQFADNYQTIEFNLTNAYPHIVSGDTEGFDAKIRKVFWVHQDHDNFRAYIVEWEKQEVPVVDDAANTRYQIGEIPTVYVNRREMSKDEQVLEFTFHQWHEPYHRP